MKITLDVPDTTEGFEIIAAIRREGGIRAGHHVKRATVDHFDVEVAGPNPGTVRITLPDEPAPARPSATRVVIHQGPVPPKDEPERNRLRRLGDR